MEQSNPVNIEAEDETQITVYEIQFFVWFWIVSNVFTK